MTRDAYPLRGLAGAALLLGAALLGACDDNNAANGAPEKTSAPEVTIAPETARGTGERPAATGDAREIIARALEAMGGRDEFESIQSGHIKGTNQTPIGDFFFELHYIKPDRALLVQSNQGVGIMSIGSDGDTVWTQNPLSQGHQLTERVKLDNACSQMNLFERLARLDEQYVSMQARGATTFDNRGCQAIAMKQADGIEHIWYFDDETGLLAGIDDTRPTGGGPQQIIRRFSRWKQFGDFTLFTRMEIEQAGPLFSEVLYGDVKFNDVDPSVFELPDEVKSLLAGG